jgi:dipeptidyl aminopeptidase/acylaminoacyl peptidase
MRGMFGRVLCFILALNGVIYSQGAKPIPIEGALKAREFGDGSWPELSPDGKWVAYLTVDRVRESHGAMSSRLDQGSVADIWVTSTETGETISVTRGIGANSVPSWSPDGKRLAFFSDRGNGSSEIWLWGMAPEQLRQVSDAPGFLLSDALVTDAPAQWLPDGRSFLVTLMPEGEAINDSKNKVLPTDPMTASEPRVPGSTVAILRSSRNESVADTSAWSLNSRLCDLAVVDTSDGAVRRIAKGLAAYKISVSPDGTHVAVATAIRFERKASQQILYDIRSIDVRTSETRTLASQVRLSILGREFAWSPDSSSLAYCLSGQEERTGDCFIVNQQAKEPPINVTNFPPKEVNWVASLPAWSADASRLYYIHEYALWTSSLKNAKARKVADLPNHHLEQLSITHKGTLWVNAGSAVVLARDSESQQSGFYSIDLDTGSYHVLLERGQNYSRTVPPHNISLSDDGHVVAFVAEDVDQSPDIYVVDQDFRHPRQVTHLNSELEQYQMGRSKAVSWNSLDGQPLHGALLLPAGYREGQMYPWIVWVYGGGNYSIFLHYFGLSGLKALNFQLLASRGYAVLMPDAPEHSGTPMTDLVKTVLPGVEKVIQMGIADPSRLGVAGHSRGGYTALSLIVQTNRFKAAMMADGFGDLISQYGELQDDGTAFQPTTIERRLGGNPWQVRERYIENSPLFYLHRVETPLLIIHGMDDRNVFPNRSDEVFVGLRRLGKEVVYARYAGETHAPTTWIYANQLDFWTRVISWFDQHLKEPQDKKPSEKE